MNNDHHILSVIDLLLKSTAILTVAFTVQHFWRRASAATLNMIWLMAFGALLALPLTRLARPLWTTSLAEKKTVRVQSLPTVLPAVMEVPVAEEVHATPARAALPLPEMKHVILGVWLIGVGLLMMRTLIGGWQLRRIKKQSLSLHQAPAGELTRGLAQAWGVKRTVALHESKDVPVPLTWGTLRPVLMLPTGADQWKREQLLAALQHELGHIKRYDVLTRGLMDFACALYWFNPLVWFAAKAMRLTQERACDDLVLNAGLPAEGYATQLLESARAAQDRFNHRLPALAMAQPSTLETRLLAIVDESRDRCPTSGGSILLTGLAGVTMLLMSAMMQLRAEDSLKTGDSSKPGPQIQISVKVISAPVGTLKKTLQGLEGGKPLSPEQNAALLQRISETPKVDILSAPSVVTRDGQKATIEVGREYVLKEEEGGKTLVGVSVNLLPALTGNGEIKLKADASIKELVSENPRPVFRNSQFSSDTLLMTGETTILSGPQAGDGDHEQIFVITAKLVDALDVKATSTEQKAKSTAQTKAKSIIIPRMVFQEASLEEAVDFLRIRSQELDPEKRGINFVIQVPQESLNASLTLDLKDIPLSEALNYVAQLTDLTLVYEGNACVFKRNGTPSTAVQSSTASASAVASTTDLHTTKAEKIIIPHLEFAGATVSETLEFLRAMSRKHDPEQKGVNLILKRPNSWDHAGASEPIITLSLKDAPLSEALRYVAALSNLNISARDNTYVLSSPDAPAATANKKDRTVKLEAEVVQTNEATGITEASGNVVFSVGDRIVKTDHLAYDVKQQKVTANGRVEITQGENVITALGQVEVNTLNGAIKVNGTSQTTVKEETGRKSE